MRLGVLDVGSNTVHLLLLDAHAGAHPIPAFSHKVELRLSAAHRRARGDRPRRHRAPGHVVAQRLRVAEDKGAEEMLAFATSAVREAANGDEVLARVRAETGVDLEVLPGPDEARLTFLAVRRWFGWSAGRLLVLDIGGGSLEIAAGLDEEPDVGGRCRWAPRRLTRDRLKGDPPGPDELRELRTYVRHAIARRLPGGPRRAARTAWWAPPRRCARWPASPAPRPRRRAVRAPLARAADLTAWSAAREDDGGRARGSPASRRAGPTSSWLARSSPTPRSTCSTSTRPRCARGRCARASSCDGSTPLKLRA